jgi:hypothetical protein
MTALFRILPRTHGGGAERSEAEGACATQSPLDAFGVAPPVRTGGDKDM